jgi:flagellar biosynthesis protein FlhG
MERYLVQSHAWERGDPAPHGKRRPKGIWTIGGGKGGTGKTLLASNLAVCLAKMGQRVLLVDADLDGANMHTCFGLERPRYGLETFLNGDCTDIKGLTEDVGLANLSLLSGVWHRGRLNSSAKDRGRLKRALRRAETDYVIVDVGSGNSPEVMDLFLLGEVGICLLIPEPTSVENTYAFLKEAIFWKLIKSTKDPEAKAQMRETFEKAGPDHFPPLQSLMARRRGTDDHDQLDDSRSLLPLKIIINQVKGPEDAELGFCLRSVIHKYFGLRVDFVGHVDFDEFVSQSVKLRSPLIQTFPDSKAARCIENITNRLLASDHLSIRYN